MRPTSVVGEPIRNVPPAISIIWGQSEQSRKVLPGFATSADELAMPATTIERTRKIALREFIKPPDKTRTGTAMHVGWYRVRWASMPKLQQNCWGTFPRNVGERR